MTPFCIGCNREAKDIPLYVEQAEEEGETPEQYARSDGTYNPENGHFLCDDCYIKAGMPAHRHGWRAP